METEEKEENNKISFFNSSIVPFILKKKTSNFAFFSNFSSNFKEEKPTEQKIPKLSDLVDMNFQKPATITENINLNGHDSSSKKPRKDSFKFCQDESIGMGLFSLKRKGSLDENMLQKKVKREGN